MIRSITLVAIFVLIAGCQQQEPAATATAPEAR